MRTSPRRLGWRFRLAAVVTVVAAAGSMVAFSADRAIPAPGVARSFASPVNAAALRTVGSPRAAEATIARLKPLHRVLGPPKPGDWLSQHEETGQTFQQYLRARPVTPVGRRTVIYVQPLGDFTEPQERIVELSAEYLGLYFQRPVKILKPLSLEVIPDSARRVHPQWGMKQIRTTYVLNDVLAPRLPNNAAAYIAFTASDLWPGDGWNFVYGQASLRNRVGVWSLHRNGDPNGGDEAFRVCLRRTLKTATHETGHMFSIQHCTAFECNMCGSNHREESDRHPLYLGPECHAKICWATAADPVQRYAQLARFCRKHKLADEEAYFLKARERLAE